MRGVYTVPATNITLANAAVTLIFINPGTTVSLRVLRAWASQAANATSAQQRVQLNTQVTAFPTLVSQTPRRRRRSIRRRRSPVLRPARPARPASTPRRKAPAPRP
jgi:hypothetical protein